MRRKGSERKRRAEKKKGVQVESEKAVMKRAGIDAGIERAGKVVVVCVADHGEVSSVRMKKRARVEKKGRRKVYLKSLMTMLPVLMEMLMNSESMGFPFGER